MMASCRHEYPDRKKKCPYGEYGVQSYRGFDSCIFHAPRDKDESEFYAQINALIGAIERGDAPFDFEGFVFPGSIDNAPYLFPEAPSSKPVNAKHARFYRPLIIKDRTFAETVDFSFAWFLGGINIEKVRFEKTALFHECYFYSRYIFSTFKGVSVRDVLDLSSSTLNGYFYLADIHGPDPDGNGRQTPAKVTLTFVNICEVGGSCFKIGRGVNVIKWSFAHSPGLAAVTDFGPQVDGIGKQLVYSGDKKPDGETVIATARALRVNLEAKRAYSEAGVFHKVEMWRRLWRARHKEPALNRVLIFLYLIVSYYGENFLLPLSWLLLLIFGSPLVYAYLESTFASPGSASSVITAQPPLISSANYFSGLVVSLKTVIPYVHESFALTTASQIYSVLERVLAWIFATFLVLAVRRHTKR